MTDENRFPCSVTARAGIFSFAACSSTSSMRQAPSSSENSVCRWRWTNSGTVGTPTGETSILTNHKGHHGHKGKALSGSFLPVVSLAAAVFHFHSRPVRQRQSITTNAHERTHGKQYGLTFVSFVSFVVAEVTKIDVSQSRLTPTRSST